MEQPIRNVQVEDDEVVEVEGGVVWTPQIEDLFINLVVEEVKSGNGKTTTLTKHAWNRIRDELKKSGRDFTFDQLKNKYNTLRQRWKDFSGLLKETGMGYISETGQLAATEETWNNLYKKYKTTKRFRKKGCIEYPKLSSIFGDTTATGSHAHPSTKSPSLSDTDHDEESSDEGVDSCKKRKIKPGNGGASKVARRQAREELQSAMAHAFTVIGENSKRKLDIWEKRMRCNSVDLEKTHLKVLGLKEI